MNTESPLQIVILGGTGDLSVRKLLPALFDLHSKKKLPQKLSIIGTARSEMSDEEYRSFVKDVLSKHKHSHSKRQLNSFCDKIFYVAGSFDNQELYLDLLSKMEERDAEYGMCSNKLYYLAVPPLYYSTIFTALHYHKMHKACDTKIGWARVLVEKPFGSDFKSAQKLDARLGSLFKEEQIFRIDHYLAKEAVQNILSFRFANTIIRSGWDNRHISEMRITMHETVDVDSRGSFYDEIGTLRDVGQNHLLQLLALLTMNEPKTFTSADIRTERAAVLKKLKPLNLRTISHNFARAQYAGYRKIKGVAPKSQTETFFALIAELDDRKWKGVPIYISAGKALKEARVEVEVIFKDVTSGLFITNTCNKKHNSVKLTISPKQAMHITLNAKSAGLGFQLESRTLSFDCMLGDKEVTNSYEKVLLDCISGDQTLFTTTSEVMAEWKYIISILKHIQNVPLQSYRKGSKGPKHKFQRNV